MLEAGYKVAGIDNLSRGLTIVNGINFYKGCISDSNLIQKIILENNIDTVMHFAAYIDVAESVREPELYRTNNYQKTITLIDTLKSQGVNNFIFSSTAAVYGNAGSDTQSDLSNPVLERLSEDTELKPINPYGFYKLEVEKYLASQENFNYIIYRYFNVAGAYGELGECHEPETHLIPRAIDSALGTAHQEALIESNQSIAQQNNKQTFCIYGNDYATPDGTAIRDYVHVVDLANAHIEALKVLQQNATNNKPATNLINQAYNLGYGKGFSVLEITNAIEKNTGLKVPVVYAPRRAGDPRKLVASCDKAIANGLFKPSHDSIDRIIKDAFIHRKIFHSMSRSKLCS